MRGSSIVADLAAAGLLHADDAPVFEELVRHSRAAPTGPIDEFEVLGLSQAVGRGVERMALALSDVVARKLAVAPADERAATLERWVAAIVDDATEAVRVLLARRLEHIAWRRLAAADLAATQGVDQSVLHVAFVDMRDSTQFLLEHGPEEIALLADTLYFVGLGAAARHDVAAGKFLGDGVLLLSASPSALVLAARETVGELCAGGPLAAGGGIAHGPVIRRAGDWLGPAVSLAARLAELAGPGELLVDDAAELPAVGSAPSRTVMPRGLATARVVRVLAAG